MERNKHQGIDFHKIPFLKVLVVSVYLNVFQHSICYIDHHLRGGNGGVLESSPRQQYLQPEYVNEFRAFYKYKCYVGVVER